MNTHRDIIHVPSFLPNSDSPKTTSYVYVCVRTESVLCPFVCACVVWTDQCLCLCSWKPTYLKVRRTMGTIDSLIHHIVGYKIALVGTARTCVWTKVCTPYIHVCMCVCVRVCVCHCVSFCLGLCHALYLGGGGKRRVMRKSLLHENCKFNNLQNIMSLFSYERRSIHPSVRFAQFTNTTCASIYQHYTQWTLKVYLEKAKNKQIRNKTTTCNNKVIFIVPSSNCLHI